MATVNPPSEQAADLLQKLSLDSQTKTLEVADANNKPGGSVQSVDRCVTPILPDFMDPTMCYVPGGYQHYYYGGYDASVDYKDIPRYVSPDGTGLYGDNTSIMYHGYGFQPYGTYTQSGSVSTVGHDGQLYGQQQYQYPAAYYQSPTQSNGPYTPNQSPATQGKVHVSVAAADKASLPVEAATGNRKGDIDGNSDGAMPFRANKPNTSLNSNGSKGRGVFPRGLSGTGYQDPRYNFNGMGSYAPWMDATYFTDGQHRPATRNSLSSTFSRTNNIQQERNHNLQPLPNLMGLQYQRQTSGLGGTPGFVNRTYPSNRFYGQYGTTARTGGFGANGYDPRINIRGFFGVDTKYKNKGRGGGFFGYGNDNVDGFSEMSRGPRAGFKNQKGGLPVTLAVRGQSISSDANNEDKDTSAVPDREQYNREEFPLDYTVAKFFIIKSYSEDDIHKSIKYSVWASTPNGNKKLDAGYQEAQEKSGDCRLFLFFSVNTSGQFVGLAEMVGRVDFNKTLDYWQQDKWNGSFPVKWHIVKDVPNILLKHITLENNDNKPVTNSRDTQEVNFEKGIQMLKIFKDYSSKSCILDDFEFYESRQKTVQEKKAKQQSLKQARHEISS
ncbi:hypothetical protein IFM89_011832 [Coptis chinensis]|uniref:YTH domain-containing family protein n=1 Tax=Coptis chinensis TaxID=261450 RepID=A0A835H5D6_9MAGN|nr:hypothetical protein IFM89_011832 [Coptis chinensis]